MLTIETASSPSYANEELTCIDLQVKFEEFDATLSFSASAKDNTIHGIELYNRALAGEFGEIAPFIAQPELPQPTTQGAQTL